MSLCRNCLDSYVWTFRKDTGTLEHWLGAVPSACLLSFAWKMVKEFLLMPEKSITLSWSRHTNLIDELVYLFFLLTVLDGVKIFRPVFITAPPSGLNRKCIHNPQNGSKLGPKRFKNYFFRIFFRWISYYYRCGNMRMSTIRRFANPNRNTYNILF